VKDYVMMDVPYFQVPNAVFDLGLSVFELAVFCYLARCANNGKVAFPSYNTIARCCGLSRRSAISAVQSLIAKGLLEKEVKRGLLGYTSNNYRVSNLSRTP